MAKKKTKVRRRRKVTAKRKPAAKKRRKKQLTDREFWALVERNRRTNPVVLDPGGISYTGPYGPMGYLDKSRRNNPDNKPRPETPAERQARLNSRMDRFRGLLNDYDQRGSGSRPTFTGSAFRQDLDAYNWQNGWTTTLNNPPKRTNLPAWVVATYGAGHPLALYVEKLKGRGQRALALEMLQHFRGQRGSVPSGSDHGISDKAGAKVRSDMYLIAQRSGTPRTDYGDWRSNPSHYPSLAAQRACEALSRSNARTKKAVIRVVKRAKISRSKKRK